MKRLLIVLLLCASAFGQNNFGGDSNCKALWRMETGALTTDSIGTNTLTTGNSPTADGTNYKEGSYSCDFDKAQNDQLEITDASLDSGFPCKNGESNKTFSICAWARPDTFSSTPTIVAKAGVSNVFWIRVDAGGKLEFYIDNGSWRLAEFGDAMTLDRWYHVTCTYDNSDQSYRIRIWDDNGSDQLGTDVTGTYAGGAITLGTDPFDIGHADGDFHWGGQIDEVVVFDDVLLVAEIDEIRQGIYGASSGAQVIMVTKQLDWYLKNITVTPLNFEGLNI
jgi:hypothetical protein